MLAVGQSPHAQPKDLTALGLSADIAPHFLEGFLNRQARLLHDGQEMPRERAVSLASCTISSHFARCSRVSQEGAGWRIHAPQPSSKASGADQRVVTAGIENDDIHPFSIAGFDGFQHFEPLAGVVRLIIKFVLKLEVRVDRDHVVLAV